MTTITEDPPGAEFYMYPADPPAGDAWAYIVDDFGQRYSKAALWPYATNEQHRESWLRICEKHGFPPPAAGCGFTVVRVSPDLGYEYTGGQEYVQIWPDLDEPRKARAGLRLWIRRQGHGAMVSQCEISLDLGAGTFAVVTFPRWQLTAELMAQAELKGRKLLELVQAEMARRDAGEREPVTAYAKWIAAGGRP